MKNLLLSLLLFQFIEINSQSVTQGSVAVLNINPYHQCRGENITIKFKFLYQPGLDGEEVFSFNYQADNLAIWAGSSFKCKEFFHFNKEMQGTDTLYVFEQNIYTAIPLGHYLIKALPVRTAYGRSLMIDECGVTSIEELNQNGQIPVYYDLRGNVIDRRSNELIIEQVGVNRRKIFIQK